MVAIRIEGLANQAGRAVGVFRDSAYAIATEAAVGLIASDRRGTIVAMTTEALRTVRDRFSEFVDRVERHHERVIVTRNGRPAAVLISPEDLAGLEETLDILGDPEVMRGLREAEAEVAAGHVVEGIEAVRALRPRRE